MFAVGQMVVHPDFRGQGIGKTLLDEILKKADRIEKNAVLDVYKDSEGALKLYLNSGFQIVERYSDRRKPAVAMIRPNNSIE